MMAMTMTAALPPLSSDSDVLVCAGPSVTCDGQRDAREGEPPGGAGTLPQSL